MTTAPRFILVAEHEDTGAVRWYWRAGEWTSDFVPSVFETDREADLVIYRMGGAVPLGIRQIRVAAYHLELARRAA